MNQAFEIRCIRPEEVDVLHEASNLVAVHLLEDPTKRVNTFDEMTAPEVQNYGLWTDDKLSGVASLGHSLRNPQYMELIYLVIQLRRRKLGRHLLQFVEQEVQEMHYPGLILWPSRTSKRFYSYQGYEAIYDRWGNYSNDYLRIFPEYIDATK